MKRVQRSKSPTVRQLLNMTANLQEKFNKATCIEITAWHFNSESPTKNSAGFRIYVEKGESSNYDSWQECQDRYFSMMRSKDE